jgi:F0F1-type ATP synthase membrane subunit b/b'
LISIRSRGNFRRPFTRVDDIETQAELETAEEVKKLNAEIIGYQGQLQRILGSLKQGEEAVIGSTIVATQKEIDLKIRLAQQQLQKVKKNRREKIEYLGNRLRNINTLAAPVAILLIAIVLGIRRGVRKRHYISHASDA